MDLNTALLSFNTINRPVRDTPPTDIETLNFKLNRLKQWRDQLSSSKEPSTEDTSENPLFNVDSYGFRGFTYQAPSKLNNGKSSTNPSKVSTTKGSDNLATAVNFFSNKGFNPTQISGIVGNLLGESALNPKAVNLDERKANLSGYGRGIAQWSDERVRNFKEVMGVAPELATLGQQLEFTWHEMQLRPALLKALKESSTVEQATDAIYRGFENGSSKALTTPEQMNLVYSKAWRQLGYRPYDFLRELQSRVDKSKKVWNYLNS